MIKPIVIDCGGRRVDFMMSLEPGIVSDTAISWYLQQGLPPEPEVVHLMSRVVQEGDLVVDAGANVGFFTLLLSKYVGAAGKVLAIEPGENNIPKLTKNMALNKTENVDLVARPLTANGEPVAFYLTRDNGTNSCWQGDVPVLASINMASTTLDEICHTQPKLLKMDIEGSEMEALKGAEVLLQQHPLYVVMEFNTIALTAMGTTPDDIREFMRKRGYELFVLNQFGLLPARVPQFSKLLVERNNTNVLFSTMDDVRIAWPEVIL